MCTTKKPPHIHAEIIKAWADGAEIEYRFYNSTSWRFVEKPTWSTECNYRIKPEPKPDVSFDALIIKTPGYAPRVQASMHTLADKRATTWTHNCCLVFDGETGKLKDVSLIKE